MAYYLFLSPLNFWFSPTKGIESVRHAVKDLRSPLVSSINTGAVSRNLSKFKQGNCLQIE